MPGTVPGATHSNLKMTPETDNWRQLMPPPPNWLGNMIRMVLLAAAGKVLVESPPKWEVAGFLLAAWIYWEAGSQSAYHFPRMWGRRNEFGSRGWAALALLVILALPVWVFAFFVNFVVAFFGGFTGVDSRRL